MSERGSYRSIPNALFSGPDFRRLSERARWVFVVLKMNVSAAGIDVWYPEELAIRLSAESGCPIDSVKLTLDILEHEHWIRRDDNLIWIVGHLTHDPHLSASDSKHRKGIQRAVAGLPHSDLVKQFVSAYPEWFPKEEAAFMGLAWALGGPRKGLRRGKTKSGRALQGPSKQEDEEENEEETITAAASGAVWPSSWAYDTTERLFTHGVVMAVGVIGKHAKAVKDKVPWDEWLRVLDRMAVSGACAYGWPAALRQLKDFRDETQLDPNRELTLDEAMAI
jgi:hypothetical protein